MITPIEQKIEELKSNYVIKIDGENNYDFDEMLREAILYGQKTKAEEVREKIVKKYIGYGETKQQIIRNHLYNSGIDAALSVLATSSEE